jgi:hypothetical protein
MARLLAVWRSVTDDVSTCVPYKRRYLHIRGTAAIPDSRTWLMEPTSLSLLVAPARIDQTINRQ